MLAEGLGRTQLKLMMLAVGGQMLAEGLGRTQLKLMMLALGGPDAGRRPGADPADAHDARSWGARCGQKAWGGPS